MFGAKGFMNARYLLGGRKFDKWRFRVSGLVFRVQALGVRSGFEMA